MTVKRDPALRIGTPEYAARVEQQHKEIEDKRKAHDYHGTVEGWCYKCGTWGCAVMGR